MISRTPIASDIALQDRRPLSDATVITIMVALLTVSTLILAVYQAVHGMDHPTATVPGLTSNHPVRWPF